MKLNYKEYGEGVKSLIILHGLLGMLDNWVTLGRKFADQGFRTFLVDQRNHGKSDHDEVFSYDVMATDLKEFIEVHGLEDPIVIGHSMGGKTAMRFACDHPDLISKLVVVDIAPKFYPIHHQTILAALNSIDFSTLKSRNEADEQLQAYLDQPGIRMFLLKNLERNPEGGYRWKMNLPVITEKIGAVGEALESQASFSKPTLFVAGSNSDYIQVEDHGTINHHFPQSEIQVIEGSGHWVHAEKPIAFFDLVLPFIA